ncbi:MAG: substrate-binding domain-containing protein, partial [Terrimicrobiaceae bacterium]
EHRALNLAVVANHKFREESLTHTYLSMLHGMEECARREGHHFLKIQISGDEFSEERAGDLNRQLDGLSVDGCLVHAATGSWIDEILEVRKIPRAHLSDYRADDIPHPCILLDPADALRSAVLRLHREGCRRIGHYGLKGRFLAPGLREAFESTMDKLGLPSGRAEYLDLDPEDVERGVERMLSFDKPPDGVYVSDDVLLKYLAAEWKKRGLTPGGDFSVITLSCRGNDHPGDLNWTRMEFNPFQVGRMAMDTLLQSIQTVEGALCSFIHVAAYIPGATTRGVT